MGQARVSVAVATYNGEKYLKEQMDSIVRNLTTWDEIVVSDDGSSDGTLAILKEYENGKVPLKIVKGPGKGIKQNISEALRHCGGRYIFLADQDDVWLDDKVESVLDMFCGEDCDLVCHDARVMNASLTKVLMPSFFQYRGSRAGFWRNLLKNRYMGCCMAFRAKLLPYVLPIPDEIPMHDQWIGMVNDIRAKNSVFLGEQLILYRRHETNVSDFSHGKFFEMLRNRLVLLRKLYERQKLWKN